MEFFIQHSIFRFLLKFTYVESKNPTICRLSYLKNKLGSICASFRYHVQIKLKQLNISNETRELLYPKFFLEYVKYTSYCVFFGYNRISWNLGVDVLQEMWLEYYVIIIIIFGPISRLLNPFHSSIPCLLLPPQPADYPIVSFLVMFSSGIHIKCTAHLNL